MKLVHKKHST